MTDTFTYDVDAGTSGKVTFRTRKAQFGDGYVQEVADGLNNKVQAWTVTKTDVYASELSPITAFLDAHGGYQSFYWTPPDGVQGLYRCAEYSVNPAQAGLRSFSGVFQEVFAP